MFNVTVINVKGSLKKVVILIITLSTVFILTKLAKKMKTSEIFKINISEKLIGCLDIEIPSISSIYEKSNTVIKSEEEENPNVLIENILGVELAKIKEIEQTQIIEEDQTENLATENIEQNTEIENETQENTETNTQVILENVETQIVTQNPISEIFNS